MTAASPFREDVELEAWTASPPSAGESLHELEGGWSPPAPRPTPFLETAESEPEAEAWLAEDDEDFALPAAEQEAEEAHPILSVFPLPHAVLAALAGGLAPLAVRLAAAAGYRDIAQLTNIVFYFRRPELIGRKIRPDERDLAAEWIEIRDRIVKPALDAAPGRAPAVAATPPVAGTALSSSLLQWSGASADELAFMRAVYDRHVERSRARGETFVADLPDSALDEIEGKRARKDAAAAARALLAEARAADGLADRVRIGITSAYRPATRQFEIWQGRTWDGKPTGGGFPYYYREAVQKGLVRAGDFSPAAVDKVATYLGNYVASPGYSNHQDGLAFDFGTGAAGTRGLGKIGSKSWFHGWLERNARRFGFHPLASEPWHWTYRPPGQSEVWAGELALPTGVRAGRVEVARVPLLARHRGDPPDLVLRWNDMASVPAEIDVVVHLHGFWYPRLCLPRDIEPVSGLDLTPIEGESGPARTRPTLTVLPRAHDTGVKQKRGRYNVYTFPALVEKDGLTELLRLSLERFAAEVGGAPPRVGRLILTAHSGGGQALLAILKHHNPHQVHVYDALYWPPGPLVEWARKRIRDDRAAGGASAGDYMATRGGALRVFYQGRYRGGTRPHSLALAQAIASGLDAGLARWYRVEASKYDHLQIPRRHGWRILADVSADVPGAHRATDARREVLEEEFEEVGAEAAVEEAEEWEELAEAVFDDGEFDQSEFVKSELEAAGFDEWEPDGHVHELEDLEDAELLAAAAAYEALSSAVEVSDLDRAGRLSEVEHAEADYQLATATPSYDVVSAAFEAADLAHDGPAWKVEAEEDDDEVLGEALEAVEIGAEDADREVEEAEASEVELGEAEAFLEDVYAQEPLVEEEIAGTVTFPSGATLGVVSGPTRAGEEHYDPNDTGNPLLDTGASVRSTSLSANFTVGELVRSGGTYFDKARIDPRLVRCLQKLRDHVGRPIQITSGYRPYGYNDKLYKEKYKKKPTKSRHSSGQAVDIRIAGMSGMEIAKTAIDVCGTTLGIGIANTFAHVDVRPEWAAWTYFDKGSEQDRRALAEIAAYRAQRRSAGATPAGPSVAPALDGAPPAVAAQMLDALGRGLWDTAVRIAIGVGITDPIRLTNMLFYLRHPELRGKRIQPEQRDLAREWVEIRDRWVRPALRGG